MRAGSEIGRAARDRHREHDHRDDAREVQPLGEHPDAEGAAGTATMTAVATSSMRAMHGAAMSRESTSPSTTLPTRDHEQHRHARSSRTRPPVAAAPTASR